jgi:phosphoenolpyruvate phosphomutase
MKIGQNTVNFTPLYFLEAHSALSALLVEKSSYNGIWISSLCHSAVKGLPDNELISLRERIDFVREIRNAAKCSIIVDIDTGGLIEHLPHYIKGFKELGVYAVVMEDKRFPKQNSLLENGEHKLEEIDDFCKKIKLAKEFAGDMKVFARLESLIAKRSVYDALVRADAYENAGADGIVIHSKQEIACDEVMTFATEFRKKSRLTLIAIPTTYKLPDIHPFNIIIHANHLLRASLKAMQDFIDKKNDNLADVNDIFKLVGK